MKDIAIILDSFSGLTKKATEARENYYFLPLKLIVDGKEYKDGIDSTPQELMKIVNKASEVKTSQPSPAEIEELFSTLSKSYKHVVYLALGSALSGTFQTAKMFAAQQKNVHVLNTRLVGKNFLDLAAWIVEHAREDFPLVLQKAEKYANSFTTFIIPKNNDAFIRGGRLGKTLAMVLNKAKVVPIISYDHNDKLKKKMIKRSGAHAVKYAVDKLIDIAKKEGIDRNLEWQICNTLDEELVGIAKELLKERGFNKVHVELTSGLINAHTGDGAISIGFIKDIE